MIKEDDELPDASSERRTTCSLEAVRSDLLSSDVGRNGSVQNLHSMPKQRAVKTCPLWLRWPRFWLVTFAIIALIMLNAQNIHSADTAKQQSSREALEEVAKTFALEIQRQLQSSISSVDVLEAMVKIDESGMTSEHFTSVADTLIRSYGGISNMQLAPSGRLERIHPLVDETQDNRAALGLNLLLDPNRSEAAIKGIESRETSVIGPVQLLQGGIALIVRRAVFTRFAPQQMPDAWYVAGGVNYTRTCSQPVPDEHCSFPGPPEDDGNATYFWGFATAIARVEDLVEPVDLQSLASGEHRVGGMIYFDYELSDLRVGAPVDFYARSGELDLPVQASILIRQIEWLLKVAPRGGWPILSVEFWRRMLIVLPLAVLLVLGLGVNILIAIWKRAHQIQQLEEYRLEVASTKILSSIRNLNLLQFPMCLLKFDDFVTLGEVICHEDAREARKLRFIETAQEAADVCRDDGVAFISHQWAGFEHPDPDGVQYRSMVTAVKEVRSRGLKCAWIWLDYSSIPQRNAFQQQTAINSLSVYASYCSVFLSVVPPCKHADSGTDVDVHSYSARAWCRLEKLSYGTSFWKEERAAYLCTEEGISDDWAGIFNDESVLDVLGGTFSCCTREHPDGRVCDKQKIVGVMLGLLWRLYATCRDSPAMAQHAQTLLELISKDEQRYFPRTATYRCGASTSEIELFAGYLPVLREMFLADTQAAHEERLAVPGVSDPWLTSSMSLAPVADELSLGSPVHPENDTESIEEVTKHSV